LGSDSVSRGKKKIHIIFLCRQASENCKKDAVSYAKKYKCPLVTPKNADLADLVGKTNCKIAAICHSGLSKSILENIDENYTIWEA
jgi:hypothetical protein